MILSNDISYGLALKDFQAGRYMQALQTLNALMDTQQDPKTYSLLAKTLLQLGFKANAASAYELAGGYEGLSKRDYLVEAIKLHHECGNEEQALTIGMRELDLVCKNADVVAILLGLQMKRNQPAIMAPYLKVLAESSENRHHSLAADFLLDQWTIVSDSVKREVVNRLFKRYPQSINLRLVYLMQARDHCNFNEIVKQQAIVLSGLANGNLNIVKGDLAHHNLLWTGDEDVNRRALGGGVPNVANARETRRTMPVAASGKIRIGYLSNDLWDDHATMKLLGSVLERHDRSRFEVILFCHTAFEDIKRNRTDRSKWGTIHLIGGHSQDSAAEQIRSRQIDILVDLKGPTKGNRISLFNRPLAPLHVSWLGFPGSTVVADLDYIVGDHVVLPESSKPFYTEKFCRLPESYQPNDPYQRPLPRKAERLDHGLPDGRFVFASFNGTKKITLETIDMWFRILRRTKDSVLWTFAKEEEARKNILAHARQAGISPARIIFTPMMRFAAHIDRIPLADLGLDTFPCNGHTTTSEQLWAGLPVLTVKGTNFASRVSESLLNAIGVPDLVMPDMRAYEDMAVELYENREKLAGYRQRLIDNRFTHPLFDVERFTHHLEQAYEMMVERARAGLEPDHFDVPALPPRGEAFHSLQNAEAAE
jgi:tetratricopeptide (TPR) repeat protein